MFRQTSLLVIVATFLCACATSGKNTADNLGQQRSGTITTDLLDVTSFDVTVDDGKIHLLVGGKISAADKAGILRYLSSNDGISWSPAQSVGNNLPKTIATRGNDIQLAAHGQHLLALWQTKGDLPGMGPLATVYSDDGGKTWQQGLNPAINDQGDQSHADLLADREGHFHTVWLEDPEENGYQSLRYSSSVDGGKSWSKAATLDGSTCSCCWNTLALSAINTLNILYRDMKPRDMALMQSRNYGSSWQRSSTVGEFGWQFDGCPHTGGGLASAGGNSPHLHSLVWTGLEAKSGLYYLHSADNGKTWSNPQKMSENAVHADIAALNDNRIAAVWDEMGAEGSSIAFAESVDGGKHWNKAMRLTNNTVNASHPRVVVTSSGFLVLWTEKTEGQPTLLAWKLSQ